MVFCDYTTVRDEGVHHDMLGYQLRACRFAPVNGLATLEAMFLQHAGIP